MQQDTAIYLTKAIESLLTAETESINGRYNSCANRCYYACFQAAITALLDVFTAARCRGAIAGEISHCGSWARTLERVKSSWKRGSNRPIGAHNPGYDGMKFKPTREFRKNRKLHENKVFQRQGEPSWQTGSGWESSGRP
jgi:hypothetical protein